MGYDLLDFNSIKFKIESGLNINVIKYYIKENGYSVEERFLELPIRFCLKFEEYSIFSDTYFFIGAKIKYPISLTYIVSDKKKVENWISTNKYSEKYKESTDLKKGFCYDILFGSGASFMEGILYGTFYLSLSTISFSNLDKTEFKEKGPKESKVFVDFNRFKYATFIGFSLGCDIIRIILKNEERAEFVY